MCWCALIWLADWCIERADVRLPNKKAASLGSRLLLSPEAVATRRPLVCRPLQGLRLPPPRSVLMNAEGATTFVLTYLATNKKNEVSVALELPILPGPPVV